jgi:hypothetical protein
VTDPEFDTLFARIRGTPDPAPGRPRQTQPDQLADRGGNRRAVYWIEVLTR